MTLPLALLATLTLACGVGGPPDGENAGDGGTGGDGGGTTTDGGATGTTTVAPTGLAGVRGAAAVGFDDKSKTWSYDGTEETYYEALDGTSWCSVVSTVAPVDAGVPACDGCDWSFTLRTSGSTIDSGCDGTSASAFNGATFSYGYAQGKDYGTFVYYYEGYGWYGVAATASWDDGSGDFSYDWPVSYLYY